MRTYLVATGTIFGLLAGGHLVELVAAWRLPTSDPWFTLGVGLIIVASGGLCVLGCRLLTVIKSPAS